jgi:hypothetical protein
MQCPGQDSRYWIANAAFDIPCPRCARLVEVFRDENSGRCRQCGHRFANPKVAFDCAAWCEYAEQCTGVPASSLAGGPENLLASRLLRALEETLEDAPESRIRALLIFQHAGQLLARMKCDARVVLPAALLLPSIRGRISPEPPGDEVRRGGPGLHDVKALLRPLGLDEAAIDRAEGLLKAFEQGESPGTLEYRLLKDAVRLAQLALDGAFLKSASREGDAYGGFCTEAGRGRARELSEAGG